MIIAGVGPFDAPGLDFLAGMGEQNIEEFGLAADGAGALRPFLDQLAIELRHPTPDVIVQQLSTVLPDVDRASLTDEFGADLAANFAEALRVSVDGWLDDDLAFAKPWGFDLDEITAPMFVWQGSEDLMVPFAHGRWLAEHVPGATAHLEHRQGHLSLSLGAFDRMLDELATTI